MFKRSEYSVYTILGVTLVSTVIFIMGLYAAFDYVAEEDKMISAIKQTSRTTLISLKNSVASDIQSFAVNDYEKLITHEMGNEDFSAIVVTNYEMGQILGLEAYVSGSIRDRNWNIIPYQFDNPEHVQQVKNCFHKESALITSVEEGRLGKISICSSDHGLKKQLRATIIATISKTLTLSFILVAFLFFVLRHFVLKPVFSIAAHLENTDSYGIPSAPPIERGVSEIFSLEQSINKMIETIRSSRKELSRHSHVLQQINAVPYEYNVSQKHFSFLGPQLQSLIGIEPEKVLNDLTLWDHRIHPNDQKRIRQEREHAFRTQNTAILEYRIKNAEGHYVWLQSNMTITSEQGQAIARGVMVDISKMKKLQEKLEKAVKDSRLASTAKSRFLANMSHEIRTPMVGIKGCIELLKQQTETNPTIRNLLYDLDSSSDALMNLLDDILDISKIEAGKLDISFTPHRPRDTIHNVINLFKAEAQRKGLNLESKISIDEQKAFLMDHVRFQQIISNLVANAIKYTEKGSVKISAEIEQRRDLQILSVSVADTGIGMSADEMKNIFKPFEQGTQTVADRHSRSGLGLSIAHRLTQIMGGTITVDSIKGQYTIFTVKMPIKEALLKQNTLSSENSLPSIHVLLAEDNIVNQRVVCAMLEHNGHTVDRVMNGLEALEQAQKQKYDIILMDMQMPEMDGEEATKAIRCKNGPNRKTPILAFTADAVREHHEKFLRAGINDIIIKPVKWDQLQQRIRQSL